MYSNPYVPFCRLIVGVWAFCCTHWFMVLCPLTAKISKSYGNRSQKEIISNLRNSQVDATFLMSTYIETEHQSNESATNQIVSHLQNIAKFNSHYFFSFFP